MGNNSKRQIAGVMEVIHENQGDHPNSSSDSSTSSSTSDVSSPGYVGFYSNEDDSSSSSSSNSVEPDGKLHDENDDEQERLGYFVQSLKLAGIEVNHDNDPQHDEEDYEGDVEGAPDRQSTVLAPIDRTDILFRNAAVRHVLRNSIDRQGGLAEGLDPTISLYIKLFEFAQTRRHKKVYVRPWGVFGLFRNLSEIRYDLLWAQDAVHRRQTNKPYVAWADYHQKEVSTLVFPYFTVALMIVSFFMMVLAFDRNGWKIEPLTVNPLFGPTPQVLLGLGALESKTMVESRQWWRLVTPMLLHAGIVHLAINMTFMATLMRMIERSHGSLRTGALFTISAVGGNIISVLMQPGFVLVGASGGIFGLMGLCAADIIMNWRLLFLIFDRRPELLAGRPQGEGIDDDESNAEESNTNRGPRCMSFPSNYNFSMRFFCGVFLFLDVLINSAVGFTPFVDNFAHLGGLVYGFLLTLSTVEQLPLGFIDQAQQSSPVFHTCHRIRQLFLRFFGFISAAMLIMISVVLVSQSTGMYSPCLSCRYMSCIPFPFWVSEEKRWWNCDVCTGVYVDNIYMRNGSPYYYTKMDMHCPQGYMKTIDIYDLRYQNFEALENDFDIICQRECE